jgi:hypothetical protein
MVIAVPATKHPQSGVCGHVPPHPFGPPQMRSKQSMGVHPHAPVTPPPPHES